MTNKWNNERIDFESYEGHTKGPWDLELWMHDEMYIYAPEIMTPDAEGTSICRMHELNQSPEQLKANGCLMADAPLLLEEVKKLREVIKKIKDCATINAQHDDTLQEEWEYILEVMRCTEETE